MNIKPSDRLNTEEFKLFLLNKLSAYLKHPMISQRRILVPWENDDIDWDEDSEELVKKEIIIKTKTEIGKEVINGILKTFYRKIDPKELKENQKLLGKSFNFYHDGVIAGGAIAALANEFLFGIPAIINDIDYFYYSHFRFKCVEDLKTTVYDHLVDGNDKSKIIKSETDGLCNFIKVQVNGYDETKVWEEIYNTFDLNCCMIAFHPISHQLLLSEQFKFFVDSQLIKHCNIKKELNFTNIIRAKRKSSELGAKYYLSEGVRNLILKDLTSSSIFDSWQITKFLTEKLEIPLISRNKTSTRFLALKDKKTIVKNPDLLLPYFKYSKDNETMVYVGQIPLISFYQEMVQMKGTWKKQKNVNKQNNWFIIKQLLQLIHPEYPQKEISKVYYRRLTILIDGLEKFGIGLATSEIKIEQLNQYLCFLKQDIDASTFYSLLNKVRNHKILVSGIFLLLNFNWKYSEIDKLMRRILNKPKEFIGILEQMIYSRPKIGSVLNYSFGINNYLIDLKCYSGDTVITQVEMIFNTLQLMKTKGNILRPKVSLGYFDKYITERTTIIELSEEGEKMHHCVGGRVGSVENGISRIFHLKISDSEQSTLELNRHQHGIIWNQGQHSSYKNDKPSPQLQKFAKLFVNYLNTWKL